MIPFGDNEPWRIIIDSGRSGQDHMAADERLAEDAMPTVRFFTWDPPAISLGFRQSPPDWVEAVRGGAAGLELVERPTGGGIAFHGSDVSVSVVVPRALDRTLHTVMSAVCEVTARLCETYGVLATALIDAPGAGCVTYCLTQPSPYAVLLDGRKVGGFALRRFPRSWLVQGSLLVRPLPAALAGALPQELRDRLAERAVALSEASGKWVDEADVAQRWATQCSGFGAQGSGYLPTAPNPEPRADKRRILV